MRMYLIAALTALCCYSSSIGQTGEKAAVATSVVQYMSGQDTVEAFFALPDGAGPHPAVILIHEWWGLNDWMRNNARQFAERGYVSLAIDLYRGASTASADIAHELMRGLPEDRAARDLKAASAFLAARKEVKSGRIGTVGWCMGGGYSLVAAMTLPQLAGAIVCYGRLVTDSSSLAKIGSPVLGIFGEKDNGIPAKSVRTFELSAKKLGKDVVVQLYPGAGHAFMNPHNTKGYNDTASKEAWQHIWSFLDTTVGTR